MNDVSEYRANYRYGWEKDFIQKKNSRKIQFMIRKLEPIIKWRLIGENYRDLEASKMKNSYQNKNLLECFNTISLEKWDRFKIILCYLYIHALLKHQRFYPDYTLNAKLFVRFI